MADKNPPSNRIEQTTVANAEENKRLEPVNVEPQFWTPGKLPLFIATLSVGILSAVGSVIASGIFTPATIVGGVIAGLTTGLAAFFGIKSGGTPK